MIPPAECLTLWEMEVECNGVFRLWKQVVWGVCAGEDVEMEGLDVLKPPGDAHGEDDVAGENVVEEVFHRVGGLFVVYTIENKEGAGMLAEPCDDSGAALVVGGVVREIEVVDEDDGKLGKGALEGLGTGGVGKEEGIILSGVAMGVFAGEPGLAYAPETVRGGNFGLHINTDGVRSGRKGVAETGEVAIAAHKEGAEGRIGEIGGLRGGGGAGIGGPEVAKDEDFEILGVGEGVAVEAKVGSEVLGEGLLVGEVVVGGLAEGGGVLFVAEVEEEGLFPEEGEDNFPLGVAETVESGRKEGAPCEGSGLGIRSSTFQSRVRVGRDIGMSRYVRHGVDGVVEGGVGGVSAAELSNEGDDGAGVVDVFRELGQRGVGIGFLAEGKLGAPVNADALEEIAEFLNNRTELPGDAEEEDGAQRSAHWRHFLALKNEEGKENVKREGLGGRRSGLRRRVGAVFYRVGPEERHWEWRRIAAMWRCAGGDFFFGRVGWGGEVRCAGCL